MSRGLIAQLLFTGGAMTGIAIALSVPFPPPRSWEQSAFLKLALFVVFSLVVVVCLGVAPRAGRVLGLGLGLLASVQIIITLFGVSRSASDPSISDTLLTLSPWLFAALGAVFVAASRATTHPLPLKE